MTRIKEKKFSLSSLGDSRVVPVYINLGPILEKKKYSKRDKTQFSRTCRRPALSTQTTNTRQLVPQNWQIVNELERF